MCHGFRVRAIAAAVVVWMAGVGREATAVQPRAERPAEAVDDEPTRRARVLAGERWRRVGFEFDEWLASQPVYDPERVRRIKADLAGRMADMSSYELEYLLDTLEAKLRLLDSPRAREAGEWVGRYLSALATRRRADLLRDLPDVLDLDAAALAAALHEIERKRSAVERQARLWAERRDGFARFVESNRRGAGEEVARLRRIRRGGVAFSPYRAQPPGEPPCSDCSEAAPPVGMGPWGAWFGLHAGGL